MDLSGKRLLVMGGTRLSCEIVKCAKRLGVTTAVADYNTVEDSPGKQIADEHYLVSVTDVDAMVELIRRERIDGIVTGFSDMLLPYYAEICGKTGLPCYGTREQFEIFTSKDRYKALCREYGVPTVEEYRIECEELGRGASGVRYPVLVKPADSSGSRGITVCRNAGDLDAAYQKALQYSKTGRVLVERYLEGKELTVFWVFQDGNYYLSAIGNRHVKDSQNGVIPLPVGYTFPSSVTEKYIHEYVPGVRAMLEAAGIRDGMMFMQCKLDGDRIVVYDIGYRLTGSLEYKILKAACGYDPMEMMVCHALTGRMAGESIAEKVNPYLGRYAYNLSFLCRPGTIGEIRGIGETMGTEGVLDAVTEHCPGETVTEQMKGLLSQICLRVLGTAADKEEMDARIQQVLSLVRIVSEDGEDMLLPGLERGDWEDMVPLLGKGTGRDNGGAA